MIPKLLGVPIILDLHDLMPEFYAGRFGQSSSFAARLIRLQERLACRFADHVITVSEHWRQALIERGVPAHKCSVVMNVADDRFFAHPTESNACPTACRMGSGLIYHGSLHQRYGLDLAVQAIDRSGMKSRVSILSLVGDGEYLPHLERMIEELGLRRTCFSIDDLTSR